VKRSKQLGAGLLALALPTMMVALGSVGANATSAGVVSSVDAIDKCEWAISTGSSTLTMTSANQYVGDLLPVSVALPDVTIGFSGSLSSTKTSGASTECAFYNAEQNGELTVELDGSSPLLFTATAATGGADTTMDFTIGELNGADDLANGLDIASVEDSVIGTACSDFVITASNTLVDLSAKGDLILNTSTLLNKYAAEANIRCAADLTIGLDIPSRSSNPAYPGQTYSFSGPTVLFVLATPAQSAP
jgi:hypothetical protein